MRLRAPRGRLLAIGGHEDKQDQCEILTEFIKLAKGAKADVVVVTAATSMSEEVGKEYTKVFKDLGAKEITVVDVSTREDTHFRKSIQAIEDATGIFFVGGDALDTTSLLGGTAMDKLLNEKFETGTIIAGTSAGAAMMSHAMIISGESENNPRLQDVQIAPGEEFLMSAIIDTHFSQRGRHGRLISAVAHYPHDIGIGIDENTAILADKNKFTVLGAGAVTVIDVGAASYTNVPDVRDGESLSLFDVHLNILPAGFGWELETNKPIVSPAVKKIEAKRKPAKEGVIQHVTKSKK